MSKFCYFCHQSLKRDNGTRRYNIYECDPCNSLAGYTFDLDRDIKEIDQQLRWVNFTIDYKNHKYVILLDFEVNCTTITTFETEESNPVELLQLDNIYNWSPQNMIEKLKTILLFS